MTPSYPGGPQPPDDFDGESALSTIIVVIAALLIAVVIAACLF